MKNCSQQQVENILKQLEKTETIANLLCNQCKFEQLTNGTMVLINNSCDGYHYLASVLSDMLGTTVMVFYTYDGNSWSYCLCDNGREIDQFSKDKQFLSYIDEIDDTISIGNVATVANCFNVKEENIANYFELYLDRDKAYEDDEYTNIDCLQMLDFMRKLGFSYKF